MAPWTLTRWDDGEPVVLADEVRDDLVALGDGTNRLELACVGSTITAIVNGEAALAVEDDTYASGGFFIGAGVESGRGRHRRSPLGQPRGHQRRGVATTPVGIERSSACT